MALAIVKIMEDLKAAKAAADAAALAQWERDGKIDCGSCGGAMLQFDARSKVAKAAVDMGLAYKSGKEVWINYSLPEGIRTQHDSVEINAKRAFKDKLIELGHASAIKRWWTYVD